MVFSNISCTYDINARSLHNILPASFSILMLKDAKGDDISGGFVLYIKQFRIIQKTKFYSLIMFYVKCTQCSLHYKI